MGNVVVVVVVVFNRGILPGRRGSTWHARQQRPQSDHSGCIGSADRLFAGLVDSYGLTLFNLPYRLGDTLRLEYYILIRRF